MAKYIIALCFASGEPNIVLDYAAENAMTGNEGNPFGGLNHSVDKQSILKIKDELF